MATNDLYKATYRFEGAASGFKVGLGFRQVSGTNDVNTLQDLVDELFLMSIDEWLAILSEQISLTGIEAYQVTGTDETPGRLTLEQPNAGDVVSDAIPMGGAAVLSLLTDAPNSKFNGRMYIAGVPESGELIGALTAGYAMDLNSLADELEKTTIALGPGDALFKPVVISRFEDGVKRATPVGFDIQSITPNLFIKNQRRRNTKFIGFGASTV